MNVCYRVVKVFNLYSSTFFYIYFTLVCWQCVERAADPSCRRAVPTVDDTIAECQWWTRPRVVPAHHSVSLWVTTVAPYQCWPSWSSPWRVYVRGSVDRGTPVSQSGFFFNNLIAACVFASRERWQPCNCIIVPPQRRPTVRLCAFNPLVGRNLLCLSSCFMHTTAGA